MEHNNSLLGVGLYSVPEVSKLTGVSGDRVRRWLCGYKYNSHDQVKETAPLWEGDIPKINGVITLSFLDLIEVKMVNAFRERGVSWQAIKEAAKNAYDLYGDKHPFSVKTFKTDGKRIFAEIEQNKNIRFIDLNKKNYVLKKIVEPSLFAGFEFNDNDQVMRWFPDITNKKVVVDPQRSFGRPVLYKEGIATDVIAKSVQVEGSAKDVANWYGIPVSAVHAAVKFENRLIV